ncbi:hypothetical protein GCM10007216_03330 [Thalassobacillus devorans]|uniref:NodB homology domain-containing protein n=1 Tax=Thalassobacillus devorans TaxID=279813 RepID=A0ABQ1NJH8_9BACI|nr:hypothetical protein [Thalassobacillus devorans]NIK27241.1 hypothetical protein [Thalassobacillus devorans]GGC76108.1 hypothetical protein GCM10007216_03330 [Thalassobacillus devorans]
MNPKQITGMVTKEMIYRGKADKKQIALTFDDGPEKNLYTKNQKRGKGYLKAAELLGSGIN